jgi:hypothetical protein
MADHAGFVLETPESWMRHLLESLWSSQNRAPDICTDLTFVCAGMPGGHGVDVVKLHFGRKVFVHFYF